MGNIDLNKRGYLRRYQTELNRTTLGGVLIMRPELDLDPEYQRGHVWTDKQASAYVGALLEGRANDSGAIVLYDQFRSERGGTDYEVVDGKQRLTSIFRFFDGEIPARFFDGFEVLWDDLDIVSQRVIRNGITVGLGTAKNLTRKEVMELYLALNSGGTVHTSDELDHVRALLEE